MSGHRASDEFFALTRSSSSDRPGPTRSQVDVRCSLRPGTAKGVAYAAHEGLDIGNVLSLYYHV
jgi:hypothetical protein